MKTSVQQRILSRKEKKNNGGKKFGNNISDKPLISRIHKKLTALQKDNPSKKWAENLSRSFSKKDLQMVSCAWKDA